MRPGRFFWKLFAGNAVLMAVILGVSVWVIVGSIERAHVEDIGGQLKQTAEHIRDRIQKKHIFTPDGKGALQSLASDLGGMDAVYGRITIIAPDGVVWADSDATASEMESHANRPEVIEAMKNGYGQSRRWSATVKRELMYVALRVDRVGGKGGPADTLGVIRVSMPVFRITEQTGTTRELIWRIAGLGLVAALLSALGLAYVWSMPIRRITEAARSLSEGDLSARTSVRGSDEIAQMAQSLNQMRESLATQLHTIDQQRHHLEHFIQTLSEGVIIAGPDGRIVLINQAACRLLRSPEVPVPQKVAAMTGDITKSGLLNIQNFVGRRVDDCIKNSELRGLLLRGASSDDGAMDEASSGVVRELPLHVDRPGGTVHLLARASDIEFSDTTSKNGEGAMGRLVVLTDVTELTRTIRMKTDFVANASHELRTPLSTIRASVETLQHLDLERDNDSARHFMEVIERHTGRLEELVGDLLDLSRLESSGTSFPRERISLVELIDDVYGRFEHTIKCKGLLWKGVCPESCEIIHTNGRLLRLVLDNLVSNAIKFTEEGGHVSVICDRSADTISVSVRDEGCGIPKSELDRVFERFYQVEAARSDTSTLVGVKRGTGLGLSIVRHAVAAMNANVELNSEVGVGTTVSVHIPVRA
ncbi:MAG TPA: ATP-binding protein [Phycisphaerae bacterium]|nr:ATP-binding protein [Phycisphaerae bacterium]HRW51450.1 ATP-binding protein [Phycisphaerae bacterium]